MLKGKKILLGITGSIAAFKAAGLTSQLVRAGAQVKVVMTEAATRFVTPLTFQTLSGKPVYQDMFAEINEPDIEHIELAEWPDIVLVCPATADIISRSASGLAGDLLSAIILTTRKPVVFVPAMNAGMWENRILQKNVAVLKELGHCFIGPDKGRLACGDEGSGRMVSVEEVVKQVQEMLNKM